jgi:hypothetical protein
VFFEEMITGGKITRITATRKSDAPVGNMNMNVAINEISGDKDSLRVKYTFKVDYEPNVAEIVIEGELHANEKNAKEIAEGYKKNKQVSPQFTEDLLTGVNYAGQAVGTLAAFAIGLQAPLTIPRAKVTPGTAANPAS